MNLQARLRDWVVLAVLLVASVAVMLEANIGVTRGLRGLSIRVTSGLEAQYARTAEFLRALEENGALREQNIELASQLARLRDAETENRRLRAMLQLSDTHHVDILATRVVERDIHRQKNFLIIDAGAEDGVGPHMAVFDDRGILGKIVQTTANYGMVQTYLNTDFRVPALIQPLQTYGIVRWDGTRLDRLLMDFVVRTEPVRKGQLVVTAGSIVFPRGLPIGTVDSVAVRQGENLLQIFLKPASRIGSVRNAVVALESPDRELMRLLDEE